ncbi:MAG: glycosyltransferase [Acetobacteraceae bacterium]
MAAAAENGVLPFIRTVAGATLFRVLRLSYVLDRPWPALGRGTRRLIWFLWSNVTTRMSDQLRGQLRGERGPDTPSDADPDRRRNIAPDRIGLAPCDAPVVSVIIPTFGQLSFTLRCLVSIKAHFPAVATEIIVVDDAFSGLEAEALAQVQGIRLLRNAVNLGFLRTCNAAARAAHGEFLLFLNNDTEVCCGWLDRLVEVFATHPDCGLVGSKLIGDDGRLHEAGGILWQGGTAWTYGMGSDPEAPEYNYVREVDYCSGASLLVRRQVFLAIGGFDEKYAPAYFEDVDLAFRLRRVGLKTFYQPRSEVMHYGGASHGRDVRFGVKSCQVTNQVTFLETWQGVLTREHFVSGTRLLRARDRARDRKVVLIVDHSVPQMDRDSDSYAIVALIRAALASGLVVKFWPFDLHRTPIHTEALQDMGVEVLYAPYQTSLTEWLQLNGADLDIILLSQPDVAQACLPVVRSGSAARIVYFGCHIHFRRMMAQADLSRDAGERRAAEVMRELEISIWREADTVLYLSEEAAAEVRAIEPSVNVRALIPFSFAGATAGPGCDIPRDNGPAEPLIIFVAGFGHARDADAAVWFVREVLPLIIADVPAARLSLVGSNPPPSVLALRGRNLSLSPNVTDDELLAWYRRARVAVVPLRSGAGVKLRSVEALWHGVPVVLTPSGAEGLPDVDEVAAVEWEPATFAAAVRDLLTNDVLWQRRSVAGAGYARDRFTEATHRQSLLLALGIVPPPAGVPAGCLTTAGMI